MEIVISVELLLEKLISTILDQLMRLADHFREKLFAVGRKLVSLFMTHAFLFIFHVRARSDANVKGYTV